MTKQFQIFASIFKKLHVHSMNNIKFTTVVTCETNSLVAVDWTVIIYICLSHIVFWEVDFMILFLF